MTPARARERRAAGGLGAQVDDAVGAQLASTAELDDPGARMPWRPCCAACSETPRGGCTWRPASAPAAPEGAE
jgi:hypothetical protein